MNESVKPHEESKFVRHMPCDHCGSSDACSEYSDGHTYCYNCKHIGGVTRNQGVSDSHEHSTDPHSNRDSSNGKGLLGGEDAEAKEIPARRLQRATLERYGYLVGEYKGQPCHAATYYSKDNQPVAQKLRFKDKTFSWIGNPKAACLFGQNLCKTKGGTRIVITEGEIDALSVSQVFRNNWPVVSVKNGASGAKKDLSDNLEFLESYEDIVLMFDNDEAGRKAVQECAPLFTPGKCRVVFLENAKDANELLVQEKEEVIAKYVFEAKTWRPDGIIQGKELWSVLEDFYDRGPDEFSFDVPFPILNAKFKGFRKGELYTLCAGSKVGKSTLAKEIMYHMMTKHGLSVGIMSLEENVRKSALEFMSLAANKPLKFGVQGLTKDKYKEAYDSTVGSGRMYFYDHFGSLDISSLLSKIRYFVVSCGCDFVLLDHISIVVSGLDGDNERKMIDQVVTKLRQLVEECQFGLLMISHVVKSPKHSRTPEEGGVLTMSDLRGSGALYQLADGVISLERNIQDGTPEGDPSKIRVLANRFTGESGVADECFYYRDTGRLLPVIGQVETQKGGF